VNANIAAVLRARDERRRRARGATRRRHAANLHERLPRRVDEHSHERCRRSDVEEVVVRAVLHRALVAEQERERDVERRQRRIRVDVERCLTGAARERERERAVDRIRSGERDRSRVQNVVRRTARGDRCRVRRRAVGAEVEAVVPRDAHDAVTRRSLLGSRSQCRPNTCYRTRCGPAPAR